MICMDIVMALQPLNFRNLVLCDFWLFELNDSESVDINTRTLNGIWISSEYIFILWLTLIDCDEYDDQFAR